MGSVNFSRVRRILWVVVVGVTWLSLSQTVAAAGALYLTPAASSLGSGAEVSLALRINPGTSVNGVQAEIGYDATKLQLVSLSDAGTAFPDIIEQNVESNPITLTRANSSNSTSSDSLIVTLRFKALIGSGSTSLTLSGNAADNFAPTNPAVQGATITFVSPSSPPPPPSAAPPPPSSSGGTSGQQGQPNQQTGDSTDTPVTGIDQSDGDQATDQDQLFISAPKKTWSGIWWLLGVLGAVVVVGGGVWLVRRRRISPAELAAEHPIDRTWASPQPETPKDEETEDLLSHTQGLNKPDPGSIIAPAGKKPDDPNGV
jgi:hypothetical protein